MQALQAFGATEAQLEQMRAWLVEQAKTTTVPVWPEHWHAVLVFLGMGTQWSGFAMAGIGRVLWQGLRYEALPPVQDAVRRRLPRRLRQRPEVLMSQIRTLEAEALKLRNEH